MDRYTLYGTFVSANVTEFFKMRWERSKKKKNRRLRNKVYNVATAAKMRTKVKKDTWYEGRKADRQRSDEKTDKMWACFSRQEYFAISYRFVIGILIWPFFLRTERKQSKAKASKLSQAAEKGKEGTRTVRISAYRASLMSAELIKLNLLSKQKLKPTEKHPFQEKKEERQRHGQI